MIGKLAMVFQKPGRQYSGVKKKRETVINNAIIAINLAIVEEILTYPINDTNTNLISRDHIKL